MKKIKLFSSVALALLGTGALAAIPSIMTGCSKGTSVRVDYDSINALKQKDLSVVSEPGVAFKEWQKLSSKQKTIDLWSELIDVIENIVPQIPSTNSTSASSTLKSSVLGDGGGQTGTNSIEELLSTIMEYAQSYLGIQINAEMIDYFLHRKLAFDVSRSTFKKTTLKNVYQKSGDLVSFDTYLWSGDLKLVIKGGIAGLDLSGLMLSFKNVPITTFHDNMSFALCPLDYDPASFIVYGDNTIFDAAGTKFAITIPSNYTKYINLIMDIMKVMNWQFPSDITSLYNKPIDVPCIALNALFGINLNSDKYGEPAKAGNFILNSRIYEYVFTNKIKPALDDDFRFVNAKDLTSISTDPWISARTNSESEWLTDVYFTNGSLANKFCDFNVTKLEGTHPITEKNKNVINYPKSYENKLVLQANNLHSNLQDLGADFQSMTSDTVSYNYSFNVSIKEQYTSKFPNFFSVTSRDFDSSFTIRKPYNWFVGNSKTATGYNITIPFWGIAPVAMPYESNSDNTIHRRFDESSYQDSYMNANLPIKWGEENGYATAAVCTSFSVVDENSRYSTADENIYYDRKNINTTNFKLISDVMKSSGRVSVSDMFNLIPDVKTNPTNFSFKIEWDFSKNQNRIQDSTGNNVVENMIYYETPNEHNEYEISTDPTYVIDPAGLCMHIEFLNSVPF